MRDDIDKICAAFPGAVASDPSQELDSWKVGGKMFACFGSRINGVSVKTESIQTAAMLIETGIGSKAPYFHASWVLLSWQTPLDELQHRLTRSYEIVVKSLPKKHRPG